MLTFINRRNSCAKVARASALGLLALAAALFQAREARAQWSQPDASGNVTSTNTGGVGVGGAPVKGSKLEVRADYGVTAGEHGLIYASRSGIGTGGVFFGYRANGTAATGGYMRSISNLPLFVGTTAVPEAMIITDGGNVGVGTTAPQSLLDISGSSGMTLRTNAASTGFSFFDRPSVPGDQVVFQGNKGNYSLFNVSTRGANIGTEKGSGMAFWTVDIANTANATQFQMHYSHLYGPIFFTQKFGTGAQGDKKISFQTAWQNTAVAPTQLVLDTSGYVGVGTAAPTERLHVSGNIRVDGNINAKYQDLAEWVPSVEKLSAGTVVILDVARDNHVATSSTSYDTRVAGVISAQPGIALGEAGEGKVLVATTGRVKVRVDATQGPVNVGDLLVTSDRPGFAMKSEPVQVGKRQMHSPGTIIGKALESLAGGTGEILVLLSMQ